MIKKIILPLLALIILGTVAWWLSNQSAQSTIDRNDTDFSVQDTSAIDKIVLRDRKGKEVTLTRKNMNRWLINNKYKASQSKILTLLTTIKEVEVKNPVPKNAMNHVVSNMAANNVKVQIYQNGELAQAYFVGHQTNDERGTYMAIANENKMPYVTHIPGFEGYLTPRYFTDVKEWRTTQVFGYNPVEITSVKVKYPDAPENNFHLQVSEGNKFRITNPKTQKSIEKPNPKLVKSYLLAFENVHFVSTPERATKGLKDSLVQQKPAVKISVSSAKSKDKSLELYPFSTQKDKPEKYGPQEIVNPEKYYAIASNRPNDILIMQRQALEKILIGFRDFDSAKKP